MSIQFSSTVFLIAYKIGKRGKPIKDHIPISVHFSYNVDTDNKTSTLLLNTISLGNRTQYSGINFKKNSFSYDGFTWVTDKDIMVRIKEKMNEMAGYNLDNYFRIQREQEEEEKINQIILTPKFTKLKEFVEHLSSTVNIVDEILAPVLENNEAVSVLINVKKLGRSYYNEQYVTFNVDSEDQLPKGNGDNFVVDYTMESDFGLVYISSRKIDSGD